MKRCRKCLKRFWSNDGRESLKISNLYSIVNKICFDQRFPFPWALLRHVWALIYRRWKIMQNNVESYSKKYNRFDCCNKYKKNKLSNEWKMIRAFWIIHISSKIQTVSETSHIPYSKLFVCMCEGARRLFHSRTKDTHLLLTFETYTQKALTLRTFRPVFGYDAMGFWIFFIFILRQYLIFEMIFLTGRGGGVVWLERNLNNFIVSIFF